MRLFQTYNIWDANEKTIYCYFCPTKERVSMLVRHKYNTFEDWLPSKVTDLIFSEVHKLIDIMDLACLDCILRDTDVSKLTIQMIIDLLSSTDPVKELLNNRVTFIERSRQYLNKIEPSRADSLLRHF